MGLKEYNVVDGHTGRETTLQLSDEDAERYGLKPSDAVDAKAKTPANKQAPKPANKAAADTAKKDDAG